MKTSSPGTCEEVTAEEVHLLLLLPPSLVIQGHMIWGRPIATDADWVEARLRTVPGIRHAEPYWHLGEPSDPWILSLTLVDGRLFALAPEGFAGGMSRCEARLYFIDWVESFLEALEISFHR